jgi:hypothetical protein
MLVETAYVETDFPINVMLTWGAGSRPSLLAKKTDTFLLTKSLKNEMTKSNKH